MKALIVEDELNCVEVLHTLLMNRIEGIEEIAVANSVTTALKKIDEFKPNIVFLDIQLGRQTCFDLLDQLPEIHFQLVFTTAYNEYALKAFDYAAVHYLLKPIVLSELVEAVNRCKSIDPVIDTRAIDQVKKLYLRTSLKDYHVTHDEIIYIKADGSYSTVYTQDGKQIFTSKKLIDYQRLLPENFFRIHHSVIVHLKWVSHMDKANSLVILINGDQLPISRRKKSEFKKVMLLK